MNKDSKPDKADFSLQSEIKKRKTQEIQRVIESKQIARAHGNMPLSRVVSDQSSSREKTSTVEARRTTQTTAFIEVPSSETKTADKTRRNLIAAAMATVFLITVFIGSFSMSQTSSAVTVTPTMLALPAVTASEVVDYLKNAGVPIANLRQLSIDNVSWLANQEIQFDVQRSANTGTFIILSYGSQDQTISDDFKANRSAKFKDWQITAISNILLLAAPNAGSDVRSEIVSHASSYLLAPYRPFLPGATPRPNADTTTVSRSD